MFSQNYPNKGSQSDPAPEEHFLNKERLLKLFLKNGRKELTKAKAKSC